MTDLPNADMSEYWNGEGGEKWLRHQEKVDASLLPFARTAMDKAAIVSGEAILDIGCGCGDPSIRLAREVGPDGRVLGVDISEPILARARSRAGAAALTNLKFDKADAQIHDFEAAAFDLVFSRFGVMFFDDPVAAFENIRGALKPGGRLAFVCWQTSKDNEWMRMPLEIIGRHVPLPEPPGPRDPGPTAFGDSARIRRIMSGAGFKQLAIEAKDTAMTLGGDLDAAVEFIMQMGPGGSAVIQAEADDATKTRIAEDLRAALAPHETPQGVVLGARSWIVSARAP